ncbi:biopolymer transporter ExbD [Chitinispirillales bacterium ANBcel5]|uniref:ExbD/TolR family protein n=1 Tax=Cellulosispirillum alkaliphilum TaxID=3039283 RepID=UPI002A596EA5|nr:biopolymer transporter ExbD [Chitinispirillales bacterium ANBcel5]
MANKIRKSSFKPSEMDLKPFMNLMVVLIPMLLVTSEFARISVIEIRLPEQRGSQTQQAQTERPTEDRSTKLLLTAIVTDSVVTLGARGGFMPSLFYREYHKYIDRDDHSEHLIEYEPDNPAVHPQTGRPFSIHERNEIYLYTTDQDRNILNRLYTQYGEMLTDSEGQSVESVSPGDTVWALTNPRRTIVVNDPSEFVSRPLSAYDELRNRLMQVKERYPDAEDADDIIIAAENEVIFDKIVQIMDAARAAEYPNISIAKLRS